MSGFQWEDEKDAMDGFDTDPTPSPEILAAARKTSSPSALAARATASRILEELDEQSPTDADDLSEAEWRLEKAGFYRAVINSQLLSSDHPAAVDVEHELQQWAKGQLETLLGIKPAQPTSGAVMQTQALQFTEDEAQALKLLAARVLTKDGPAKAPEVKPVPQNPIPQPVKPVASKPPPAIRPVEAKGQSGTRGRGRPRKYACKVCGLMECDHKVKETKPAVSKTAPAAELSDETYDGVPIQVAPDGTKFVDAANGRRYKLEVRVMTHKHTGKQREAYVPIEWSRPQIGAKPYPSDAEVAQLAAVESHQNMSRAQASPVFQKMVNAALAAPEKEPYVPAPTES